MEEVLGILAIFSIIYFVDFFILKKCKIFKFNEKEYIEVKYNIKIKKNYNYSILNSFIITLVITFALIVEWPLYLLLPVAFILLLLLIYSVYGIYGNYLRSKENEKKKKTKRNKY